MPFDVAVVHAQGMGVKKISLIFDINYYLTIYWSLWELTKREKERPSGSKR